MKLTNESHNNMEGSSLETLPKQCWPEQQNAFDMHPQQNATNTVQPRYNENVQGLPSMDFSQLLQSPDLFQGSMTDMLNGIDMHNVDMHLEPNASGITMTSNTDFSMPNSIIQEQIKKTKPKKQRSNKTSIDSEQEDGEELVRRKRRRASSTKLNGLTEEEALARLMPDHLCPNLDIVIIGINPGLTSASVGHHYAGPANHFWKCMYLSGLIQEPFTAYDDFKLLKYGIGFTNIVARTTRASTDLSRKEIKEGAKILQRKMEQFKPKIAVFNGIGIYELFIGRKDFHVGKQPHSFPGVDETTVFVMPSSSARFTQLPRAVDKLPFYLALKKLRDYLNGRIPPPAESEISFPEANFRIIPKSKRPGYVPEGSAEDKKALMKKKRIRRFKKDEGEEEDAAADTSRDASVSSDFNNSQEEISPVTVPMPEAPPEPKERLTPIASLLKIRTDVNNEVNDPFTDALLSLSSSLSPIEQGSEAVKTPDQRGSIDSASSVKLEDASSSGINSPPQANGPFTPNPSGVSADFWADLYNSPQSASLPGNMPSGNQGQSMPFSNQENFMSNLPSSQGEGATNGNINMGLNHTVSSAPTGPQTVSGNYGNVPMRFPQGTPNNSQQPPMRNNANVGFMQGQPQMNAQMRFPFGGPMHQPYLGAPNQMPYNAQGISTNPHSSTNMPQQPYMPPLSSHQQHIASPHFMPHHMTHPGMRATSPLQQMNPGMHSMNQGLQPSQQMAPGNPGLQPHQQMAPGNLGLSRTPQMPPGNPGSLNSHPSSVHRNPNPNQTFPNQWQGSPPQGAYSFIPEASRGGGNMQQAPARHPFWDSL